MTLLPTYYYKVKKPTHASMMNKHYSQRKTTSIINEIIHASMQNHANGQSYANSCMSTWRQNVYISMLSKKKPTVYDALQRKRGRDYHNGAFSPTNLKVFVITTTWMWPNYMKHAVSSQHLSKRDLIKKLGINMSLETIRVYC